MKKFIPYKVDANQRELVSDLEELGVRVIDTHAMGKDFPDLVCGLGPEVRLVEIKNPEGKNTITKGQREFAAIWPVYVIRTSIDVVDFVVEWRKTLYVV